MNSFFYWVPSNIWSWWGMDHAASAFEAIGHPEAGRLRAEADAYRADILRSLTIARQHNPLVRLRDGRWVPHYPTHIYRRGRELGWIRETLEGSVNLLLCVNLGDANAKTGIGAALIVRECKTLHP